MGKTNQTIKQNVHTMSPLPYQTDTTEKLTLVNTSSTTVPGSMWKKAGVAMTIGTLFVAGNTYRSNNNSAMIRPTDSAAASVAHITFGDMTVDDPYVPSCDKTPAIFKDVCECTLKPCGSLVGGFVNGDSDAIQCLKANCFGGDSFTCFVGCFGKDTGPDGKKLVQCVRDSGCLSPFN